MKKYFCKFVKKIGILLIYYLELFHILGMSHANFHEHGIISQYFKNVSEQFMQHPLKF